MVTGQPPADTQQDDEVRRLARELGQVSLTPSPLTAAGVLSTKDALALARVALAARPSADTETGAWVCARCGESPPAHAAAGTGTGRCVYEPIWRPSADTAPLRRVRELADSLADEGGDETLPRDWRDPIAYAARRLRAVLDGGSR